MHFDSRIKKACRSTQHLQIHIHFHFPESPSKAYPIPKTFRFVSWLYSFCVKLSTIIVSSVIMVTSDWWNNTLVGTLLWRSYLFFNDSKNADSFTFVSLLYNQELYGCSSAATNRNFKPSLVTSCLHFVIYFSG